MQERCTSGRKSSSPHDPGSAHLPVITPRNSEFPGRCRAEPRAARARPTTVERLLSSTPLSREQPPRCRPTDDASHHIDVTADAPPSWQEKHSHSQRPRSVSQTDENQLSPRGRRVRAAPTGSGNPQTVQDPARRVPLWNAWSSIVSSRRHPRLPADPSVSQTPLAARANTSPLSAEGSVLRRRARFRTPRSGGPVRTVVDRLADALVRLDRPGSNP